MALHAWGYCRRLFYLEEVEEIRLADERVHAGRADHAEIELGEAEERQGFELASEKLGLAGKLDALRLRDGSWIPYEFKRGRAFRTEEGGWEAWESDRLQVLAYAMLLEEHLGKAVPEGRIRYLASAATVRVPLDEAGRADVTRAVDAMQSTRTQADRPPVAEDSGRCARCSLAPVCLPEEERVTHEGADRTEPVPRLFPPHPDGRILHITRHDLRVSCSGGRLVVRDAGNQELEAVPVLEIGMIVIHGNAQVTTQAIHACARLGKPIFWFTRSGAVSAGLHPLPGGVQRRIRQFQALCRPELRLRLARLTAMAKVQNQLRYVLRVSRGDTSRRTLVLGPVRTMRSELRAVAVAGSVASVRGHEGMAARAWFEALPAFIAAGLPTEMHPLGRSRRPPRDPFNALLSFGYAMLYRQVLLALLTVGLEPAFGFYHTPRSAAQPLVLDLMELFRLPLVDVVVLGAFNRQQFGVADFHHTRAKTWLSDEGKRKAIDLFERRLEDTWKHPVLGYSLSYARMVELEARLLEKEWSGSPGLFAKSRLR